VVKFGVGCVWASFLSFAAFVRSMRGARRMRGVARTEGAGAGEKIEGCSEDGNRAGLKMRVKRS